MTAITPLESIHKKGLFGDHHKKNESDLLKISEVKDLTVVQIVQYKRSKVQLSSIQIDGLEFFLQSPKVSSNKETRILWSAPSTWLVISRKENIVDHFNLKFHLIGEALRGSRVLLGILLLRVGSGKRRAARSGRELPVAAVRV